MAVLRRRAVDADHRAATLDVPDWLALGSRFSGGFYEGFAPTQPLALSFPALAALDTFSMGLLDRLGPAAWGVSGLGAATAPQSPLYSSALGLSVGRFGGSAAGGAFPGFRSPLGSLSWLMPERPVVEELPTEAPFDLGWAIRQYRARLAAQAAQSQTPSRRARVVAKGAAQSRPSRPMRNAPVVTAEKSAQATRVQAVEAQANQRPRPRRSLIPPPESVIAGPMMADVWEDEVPFQVDGADFDQATPEDGGMEPVDAGIPLVVHLGPVERGFALNAEGEAPERSIETAAPRRGESSASTAPRRRPAASKAPAPQRRVTAARQRAQESRTSLMRAVATAQERGGASRVSARRTAASARRSAGQQAAQGAPLSPLGVLTQGRSISVIGDDVLGDVPATAPQRAAPVARAGTLVTPESRAPESEVEVTFEGDEPHAPMILSPREEAPRSASTQVSSAPQAAGTERAARDLSPATPAARNASSAAPAARENPPVVPAGRDLAPVASSDQAPASAPAALASSRTAGVDPALGVRATQARPQEAATASVSRVEQTTSSAPVASAAAAAGGVTDAPAPAVDVSTAAPVGPVVEAPISTPAGAERAVEGAAPSAPGSSASARASVPEVVVESTVPVQTLDAVTAVRYTPRPGGVAAQGHQLTAGPGSTTLGFTGMLRAADAALNVAGSTPELRGQRGAGITPLVTTSGMLGSLSAERTSDGPVSLPAPPQAVGLRGGPRIPEGALVTPERRLPVEFDEAPAEPAEVIARRAVRAQASRYLDGLRQQVGAPQRQPMAVSPVAERVASPVSAPALAPLSVGSVAPWSPVADAQLQGLVAQLSPEIRRSITQEVASTSAEPRGPVLSRPAGGGLVAVRPTVGAPSLRSPAAQASAAGQTSSPSLRGPVPTRRPVAPSPLSRAALVTPEASPAAESGAEVAAAQPAAQAGPASIIFRASTPNAPVAMGDLHLPSPLRVSTPSAAAPRRAQPSVEAMQQIASQRPQQAPPAAQEAAAARQPGFQWEALLPERLSWLESSLPLGEESPAPSAPSPVFHVEQAAPAPRAVQGLRSTAPVVGAARPAPATSDEPTRAVRATMQRLTAALPAVPTPRTMAVVEQIHRQLSGSGAIIPPALERAYAQAITASSAPSLPDVALAPSPLERAPAPRVAGSAKPVVTPAKAQGPLRYGDLAGSRSVELLQGIAKPAPVAEAQPEPSPWAGWRAPEASPATPTATRRREVQAQIVSQGGAQTPARRPTVAPRSAAERVASPVAATPVSNAAQQPGPTVAEAGSKRAEGHTPTTPFSWDDLVVSQLDWLTPTATPAAARAGRGASRTRDIRTVVSAQEFGLVTPESRAPLDAEISPLAQAPAGASASRAAEGRSPLPKAAEVRSVGLRGARAVEDGAAPAAADAPVSREITVADARPSMADVQREIEVSGEAAVVDQLQGWATEALPQVEIRRRSVPTATGGKAWGHLPFPLASMSAGDLFVDVDERFFESPEMGRFTDVVGSGPAERVGSAMAPMARPGEVVVGERATPMVEEAAPDMGSPWDAWAPPAVSERRGLRAQGAPPSSEPTGLPSAGMARPRGANRAASPTAPGRAATVKPTSAAASAHVEMTVPGAPQAAKVGRRSISARSAQPTRKPWSTGAAPHERVQGPISEAFTPRMALAEKAPRAGGQPRQGFTQAAKVGTSFKWGDLIPANLSWLVGPTPLEVDEPMAAPTPAAPSMILGSAPQVERAMGTIIPTGAHRREQPRAAASAASAALPAMGGVVRAERPTAGEIVDGGPAGHAPMGQLPLGQTPRRGGRWNLDSDVVDRWSAVARSLASVAAEGSSGALGQAARAARSFLEVSGGDLSRAGAAAQEMAIVGRSVAQAMQLTGELVAPSITASPSLISAEARRSAHVPASPGTASALTRASLGFLFKGQPGRRGTLADRFETRSVGSPQSPSTSMQSSAAGFDVVSMTQLLRGLTESGLSLPKGTRGAAGGPDDSVAGLRAGLAGMMSPEGARALSTLPMDRAQTIQLDGAKAQQEAAIRPVGRAAPRSPWTSWRLAGKQMPSEQRQPTRVLTQQGLDTSSLTAPSSASGLDFSRASSLASSLPMTTQRALVQAEVRPTPAPAMFKESLEDSAAPPVGGAEDSGGGGDGSGKAPGIEEVIEEVRWRLQLEQKWESELE